MKLRLQDGLPFVTVTLSYQQRQLELSNVLIDTGSAGTLFATDHVAAINLTYEADDAVRRIRGVGGAEFVFVKQVDQLALGQLQIADFEVEVGAMDYGFAIAGIIGMDFLLAVGAVIDLATLTIRPAFS